MEYNNLWVLKILYMSQIYFEKCHFSNAFDTLSEEVFY